MTPNTSIYPYYKLSQLSERMEKHLDWDWCFIDIKGIPYVQRTIDDRTETYEIDEVFDIVKEAIKTNSLTPKT